MTFDDLKVTWDSQSEEPLYALNEEGFRSLLRIKTREFKRLVSWQQIQTYGSSLVVVSFIAAGLVGYFTGMLPDRVGIWGACALGVAAICWIQFAATVYFGYQRQLERERHFGSSLRDELDRDIAQVTFQIRKRKHIMLGFIPPYFGGFLFTCVVFHASGISAWALVPFALFMVGALIFESRGQQRLVDRRLMPRKQELEALRDKLASSNGHS